MKNVLWTLLPDEFLPLLVVAVGLAIMLRLVSIRAGVGFLGFLLVTIVLSPFLEMVIAQLPSWLRLLLVVLFVISILQGLAGLLIGGRAADHMAGSLAADAVRFFFRMLFFPVRLLWIGVRRW